MRLIAIALVAPLALVLIGLPIAVSWKPASEPRTLADVIASAERNGLYWTSVPVDDPNTKRLIVSATPLDEDAAALVNLSFPTEGVASCYIAWETVRIHYDPNQSAFWGDIFVHGDPAIVKMLTGATPAIDNRREEIDKSRASFPILRRRSSASTNGELCFEWRRRLTN